MGNTRENREKWQRGEYVRRQRVGRGFVRITDELATTLLRLAYEQYSGPSDLEQKLGLTHGEFYGPMYRFARWKRACIRATTIHKIRVVHNEINVVDFP